MIDTQADAIPTVTTALTAADRRGMVLCRLSRRFRSSYRVTPGLYAVGTPNDTAAVFVTANYRFSFDYLRSCLTSDAYILVLDTKGINVSCAAGKGTFGTDELIHRIAATSLERFVSHRVLVVPQLGAPGIAAHRVKKETGFTVKFGPVDAGDIPEYLAASMKCDRRMRSVRFGIGRRLALTPIEILRAIPVYLIALAAVTLIYSFGPGGFGLSRAMSFLGLAAAGGGAAIFVGGIVVPALLPFIPFRAFHKKGWFAGSIVALALFLLSFGRPPNDIYFLLFVCTVALTVVSLLSFLFTGSTTFTSLSGVEKETKSALPAYITAAVVCGVFLVSSVLAVWGVIQLPL